VPRGLTRDYDTFGTRGHVDIVACLPSPGVALVHDQQDASHPDHAVSAEVVAVLGDHLDVLRLPAPTVLRDDEGPVDYSYVNHLVTNDGVVACTFDDPNDDRALGVLADAYPGRRVVGVDARPLFARGGGIHCITQQQPAV
jgi:agmatine deiminase